MTIDDNIKDKELKWDIISSEAAKLSALWSGKIEKYEYLTNTTFQSKTNGRTT